MKKFIAIGILFSLIFSGCFSTQPARSAFDPDFLMEVERIAIEVAKSIKYYDNLPNHFIGENEIEGQCGDYAVLFALKTGANLVIQQNESVGVKNGIYRLDLFDNSITSLSFKIDNSTDN